MALLNIVICAASEPNSIADPRTERVDVVKKYFSPSSNGLFFWASREVSSSNVMSQLIVLGVAKLNAAGESNDSNHESCAIGDLRDVGCVGGLDARAEWLVAARADMLVRHENLRSKNEMNEATRASEQGPKLAAKNA